MASTNIQRVHTSAPTDNKKCTISVWVKKSGLSGSAYSGIYGGINAAWNAAGNVQIGFSSDKAYCWFKTAGGDRKKQDSTRVFRDTNAWYHFVYRIDTTQSTASDRIRVYCNNEELTSWGSTADPALNEDISFTTNGYTNYIGKFNFTSGGVNYFSGVLSHFHLCDGYSYAPTEFGSTDANGVWTINTSPNVQYGNNGYFILKDGNSLTDQSGQSNNWSSHNGTLTKTEDCPSNVFATMNPLVGSNLMGSTVTFDNGNTRVEDPSGSASGVNPYFSSTLGMPSKGKFYCELKPNSFSTNSGHGIGIFRTSSGNTADNLSSSNYIRYIYNDTSIYITKYGSSVQSGLTAISSGDIVGMALDLDNGTLQYYVNGVARGSQITGVNSANDGYDYFFFANLESSSSGRYGRYYWNFGNGYFATTAVTTNSGNGYAGADGKSIFNYQPPTGYSALSTKGLNL